MVESVRLSGSRLNPFRGYLRFLAEAHIGLRLRTKLEPSDVVQQTLLEAYQQRADFAGKTDAELAEWLRRMLVHNIADAVRGWGRMKRDVSRERPIEAAINDSFSRAESWLAADISSPSQQAIRGEQLVQMAAALARLPDAQRQAVVLHHLHGCTLAELARTLEKSESAVAGLLHRGLQRLRQLLDES